MWLGIQRVDIEELLSGVVDGDHCFFVANVVKSFGTVDRGVLDLVLSGLGRPTCCRLAYFEVMLGLGLRLKLAFRLGEPWTRDGGTPQGCPLSMMFIIALHAPWCQYLGALGGIRQ